MTILRPGNWIMPGRFGVGGRKSGRKSWWAIMKVSPLSLLDDGARCSGLVDGVLISLCARRDPLFSVFLKQIVGEAGRSNHH